MHGHTTLHTPLIHMLLLLFTKQEVPSLTASSIFSEKPPSTGWQCSSHGLAVTRMAAEERGKLETEEVLLHLCRHDHQNTLKEISFTLYEIGFTNELVNSLFQERR